MTKRLLVQGRPVPTRALEPLKKYPVVHFIQYHHGSEMKGDFIGWTRNLGS